MAGLGDEPVRGHPQALPFDAPQAAPHQADDVGGGQPGQAVMEALSHGVSRDSAGGPAPGGLEE